MPAKDKDVELEETGGDSKKDPGSTIRADTRPRFVQLLQRRRKTFICLCASFVLLIIIIVLGANYGETVYATVQYQACYAQQAKAYSACSNNGLLYPEAPEEGCVCFGCWTSPPGAAPCSSFNVTCEIQASGPQTYLFESFWLKNREQIPLVTGIDYRLPYTSNGDDDDDDPATKDKKNELTIKGPHSENQNKTAPGLANSLQMMVRGLHAKFRNAVTKDRLIVFGTGATQLQNAAIWAFSQKLRTSENPSLPYFFPGKVPYDPTMKFKCEVTRACNFTQRTDLTLEDNIIEMVTRPSTPDGNINGRIYTGVSDYWIYDLSGYWQHLSPDSANLTMQMAPVMLFSWSRLTGHAGSRLGWAIIEDKTIADLMAEYIEMSINDVSIDTAHRALSIGNFLLNANDQTSTAFFDYTDSTITRRWKKISIAVEGNSEIVVAGRQNTGWLWLRYEGDDAMYTQEKMDKVFKDAGIIGNSGTEYGVVPPQQPHYAINILLHDMAFDLMMTRLCKIFRPNAMEKCTEQVRLVQ